MQPRFSYRRDELPWVQYERMKRDIAEYAQNPREYERLIRALGEVVP